MTVTAAASSAMPARLSDEERALMRQAAARIAALASGQPAPAPAAPDPNPPITTEEGSRELPSRSPRP